MPTRRLFVALRLPEAVSDALLDLQEGLEGARWQDADNLHLTLRFVGEVSRHEADDLEAALAQVSQPGFEVELKGVGHFEHRQRPKAIWARVPPSPGLTALQHSVEMACRRAGQPTETRKFIPHVTLARLKGQAGDIGAWLARHGDLALGPWRAERFSLFESHLTPNGAFYDEVTKFHFARA